MPTPYDAAYEPWDLYAAATDAAYGTILAAPAGPPASRYIDRPDPTQAAAYAAAYALACRAGLTPNRARALASDALAGANVALYGTERPPLA